jgi:ATP adenylyltransferase
MERIYAPWRMSYVTGCGDAPKPDGCVFCARAARPDDAANFIVHRGDTCFVILNAFPYANGHLMVLPYRHVARLAEMTAGEHAEMMTLAARMTETLDRVSSPDGYNVGMNLGGAAGAGIADHLHLHVVPRWNGDTNFMPVLGDVKILPETLGQVYAKITAALSQPE